MRIFSEQFLSVVVRLKLGKGIPKIDLTEDRFWTRKQIVDGLAKASLSFVLPSSNR